MTCPICERRELTSTTERACQVCAICARPTGVRPLPPSRRPPAPCQRCHQTSFVRALPRTHDEDRYAPIAATFAELDVQFPALGGVRVSAGSSGRGLLELYICRGCGFVEWYCQDPGELPIGPQYMTELVEYDTQAPYR